MPYSLLFFAFVIDPICYGLWLDSQLELQSRLFNDPRYRTAVLNMTIYVGVGVNLKMCLAFLLSGIFMRKSWWTESSGWCYAVTAKLAATGFRLTRAPSCEDVMLH
jgi:ABC-type sugar transport system permease subunit